MIWIAEEKDIIWTHLIVREFTIKLMPYMYFEPIPRVYLH